MLPRYYSALLIGHIYIAPPNQQKKGYFCENQVLEICATSGYEQLKHLPDSTLVYLNAGSVLQLYLQVYRGNKREVELRWGERGLF